MADTDSHKCDEVCAALMTALKTVVMFVSGFGSTESAHKMAVTE